MTLKIRHLATRFALLLALAAVVPLVAYGAVSIFSLQRGTRDSVITGNMNVATRAAEEIRRYVTTNADILKALAADLQDTGLTAAQQDRILKNYILQFREFHELTLFDEQGATLATSRIGKPGVQIPKSATLSIGDVKMSPIRIDADLLPTALFAVRLTRLNQPSGWLVGEISLEEMWRMVDQIRIGGHGYALVIGPNGQLIAHGDPDKKALVAQARNMGTHALVGAAAASPDGAPVWREYVDEGGRQDLGVAARVVPLGWTVVVEQPTAEAYATATQLQRQLIVAISDRAARHDFGRVLVGPLVHHAHPHAQARDAGSRRRPAGRARRHPPRRRVRRPRRGVQHDGGPSGQAAGGREAPGAAGDVRPHGRRPRPRPLAPDSEHRQQLASAPARRQRRRIARHVPPHHRA